MWVEYMKSKDRSMLLALAYSPDNTRLKILEGLFKIVGAEEDAKVLQDYELTFWEKKKVSAVSLFTKLKLNDVPRKFYFDMWVMYVVRTLNMPIKDMRSVITMLSRRYGDEGLLEMLDALEKTGFNYHMRVELKSALTTSWKNKKKSPHDVFKLLKLNMESEPNHSVDIQRLSMWFQYVDENLSRPGTQMEEVIRDCELDIRVMVLGGLKKIDGAEYVVKILENSLLELFNGRDGLFGDQVVQVFRDLKLDDGLEKLLRHPNLDLFNKFAAKFEPGKTKEASLITAARTVYKDIPLGKTLMAAQGYDVTVKPLLFELFKQWKERHQRIVNQLEGDPHADTKAFVLAFGREW
ncbi:hypothetical protein KXD40_006108 [Peronospora effusa]|uniref:RXLR phytopathogen effector protein WY-domain domain-containing protein n=1 Tax=Peronospora effusa TaxID=542832 RepID=A0A3R7VXV0_9STRA|nr:hypothetical protein DD237_007415 [Peronospora effusa]UIZ25924.1 hypothetical protein KXD40_006108 [Peronospora effusa]CAI5706809.1 unnamed protein product [Peronospora effusa]